MKTISILACSLLNGGVVRVVKEAVVQRRVGTWVPFWRAALSSGLSLARRFAGVLHGRFGVGREKLGARLI